MAELNSDQKKKRDTIARMVGNMLPFYHEWIETEAEPVECCIADAFSLYEKIEQRLIAEAEKGTTNATV